MQITVLAGGIGGARFLSGVRDALGPSGDITVIGNTADDVELFGLHISPDLDSVMYTLGGGADAGRGWGRSDEGWRAKAELAAYGEDAAWFGLGDRDLATHLVRTRMLREGRPLSAVTEHLCRRWQPGVRLLPMSDDPVQTYVLVGDGNAAGEPASLRVPGAAEGTWIHFQEWWIRHGARLPAREFRFRGAEDAAPAPGVLDALRLADVILLAPSNPVVSLGPILAVPGVAEALREAPAPVVGVSPIIGGAPVRGMADACLPVIEVATSAAAVARHYGLRRDGGLLDGWLVDVADEAEAAELAGSGWAVRSLPLLMRDPDSTHRIVRAALDLADQTRP